MPPGRALGRAPQSAATPQDPEPCCDSSRPQSHTILCSRMRRCSQFLAPGKLLPTSEASTGHKCSGRPQHLVWVLLEKYSKCSLTQRGPGSRRPGLGARETPQHPALGPSSLATSPHIKSSRARYLLIRTKHLSVARKPGGLWHRLDHLGPPSPSPHLHSAP